jgi:hypothetical protein
MMERRKAFGIHNLDVSTVGYQVLCDGYVVLFQRDNEWRSAICIESVDISTFGEQILDNREMACLGGAMER